MTINTITGYRYTLPFNTPVSLLDTVLTHRQGLLVALETASGQLSWGEAAPLPGFSTESLTEITAQAWSVAHRLKKTADVSSISAPVLEAVSPSVYFGLESALRSLSAQETGLPLHLVLNPCAHNRIPLCALIAGTPEEKRAHVRRAVDCGYKTLKLKVGRSSVDEDAALVREVLEAGGPDIRLRLDANRAWNREQALAFCATIPADQIAFIEEPTRDFRDLPGLQDNTGIACAVDETLQELSRCLLAPRTRETHRAAAALRNVAEQARYLVWKPSLCLPLSLLDVQSKAPVVLSAAYETGVGTSAILAYAAAFSADGIAAGVDTYTRLASDVLATPLALKGPEADLAHVETVRTTVDPVKLELLWHV